MHPEYACSQYRGITLEDYGCGLLDYVHVVYMQPTKFEDSYEGRGEIHPLGPM